MDATNRFCADRPDRRRRRLALAVAVIACLTAAPGPGYAGRAPLKHGSVVWYADDRSPVPQPAERDPNLLWDHVEDSVVLPRERFTNPVRVIRHIGTIFGGDHVPAAANVNALDEVPNSSWFTNRIGLYPMTPEEVATGPGGGDGPDTSGKWTVVSAKTQGVTPGFTIEDPRGDRYLIKFDPPGFLGLTGGAGVISARILHAAGYNVPEDVAVTFHPNDLVLGDGVTLKISGGGKRHMTQRDLDRIVGAVQRLPNGEILAISSKFLDGVPVGPFDYKGRRDDDPNDRVDHEHRRELRGLKYIAGWINHFDTKQHNSLDMYVSDGAGGGYVKHHLIDFASTLGTGAGGPSRRYGHEYTVDLPAILGRTLTVGLMEDVWRKKERPEGLNEVGYFDVEHFHPDDFEPQQPNSAFANCTDRDAYWATKIIVAFRDEHLRAIAAEAKYPNPGAAEYMSEVLAGRRDKIARHVFARVPPLDFFAATGGTVTFADLAVRYDVYPGTTPAYRVRCAAVEADRSAAEWSDWTETTEPAIELDAGSARAALAAGGADRYPFVAVQAQVRRDDGDWSDTVTAYVSRVTNRVVAVDR